MTQPTEHADEPVRPGGVLAAVDGSQSADRALAWAVREAQARGDRLTIAHSYHWPNSGFGTMEPAGGMVMDSLAQDSEEILRAAERAARALAPDLDVASLSRLGPPVSTLVGLSHGRDLVVVGSRGLGGFTGMLLGSVGTGLVSGAACSVAVVRGDRIADPADPVVVGVDGAPSGDAVLAEAFRAAQHRGCPLLAVHCWQEPTADLRAVRGREEAVDQAPWQQAVTSALAEQLARVGEHFADVRAESTSSRGRPSAVLLEHSARAQLLVVGTRGRSELAGMLLGSTSRAMVQHAQCPVIVARPPEQ